jgi:predicted kinase
MTNTTPAHLYLIRGLPGSGKTTLALALRRGRALATLASADDFFLQPDGSYRFGAARLKEAHAQCQAAAEHALERGGQVIVHNTFSQRWEMEPYILAARRHGALLTVISIFDSGLTDIQLFNRGTHDVPLEVINRMRARYEHDWLSAPTLPPWERE